MKTENSAPNTWEGKRIRLRAVEPSDWQFHYEWNRSSDDCCLYDRVYFPGSITATRQWAERESAQSLPGDNFRFQIETLDGTLAGGLNTFNCDPRNGTFSYGLALHSDHRRKGYASEAIHLVLRYYFNELRYQKVTVVIFDFNTASIRLHESLGFQCEGRLRRMEYTNGHHADHLMYGLTDDEWRAAQVTSS